MMTFRVNTIEQEAYVKLTKENVKDILFGLYELQKHYHDKELNATLNALIDTNIIDDFSELFDDLYRRD